MSPVCIVYPYNRWFPPASCSKFVDIERTRSARRYRSLKNTQGKLACWLYVQRESARVCKERGGRGLAGISRMLHRLPSKPLSYCGNHNPSWKDVSTSCVMRQRSPTTLFLKQTLSIKTTCIGSLLLPRCRSSIANILFYGNGVHPCTPCTSFVLYRRMYLDELVISLKCTISSIPANPRIANDVSFLSAEYRCGRMFLSQRFVTRFVSLHFKYKRTLWKLYRVRV